MPLLVFPNRAAPWSPRSLPVILRPVREEVVAVSEDVLPSVDFRLTGGRVKRLSGSRAWLPLRVLPGPDPTARFAPQDAPRVRCLGIGAPGDGVAYATLGLPVSALAGRWAEFCLGVCMDRRLWCRRGAAGAVTARGA